LKVTSKRMMRLIHVKKQAPDNARRFAARSRRDR